VSDRSTSPSAAPPRPMPDRRRLLALLGLGVAAALGACGKKGPLRHPEPAAPNAGTADEETE
jgi:predicted small lipoprotein YifL